MQSRCPWRMCSFPRWGTSSCERTHVTATDRLKDVFKAHLAGQATTVVVSDCRVDWNLPGVRPLGPDIAVFADVGLVGIGRPSTWRPKVLARLVVEVTSLDTRQSDVGKKVDFSYQAGISLYVIAVCARGGRLGAGWS